MAYTTKPQKSTSAFRKRSIFLIERFSYRPNNVLVLGRTISLDEKKKLENTSDLEEDSNCYIRPDDQKPVEKREPLTLDFPEFFTKNEEMYSVYKNANHRIVGQAQWCKKLIEEMEDDIRRKTADGRSKSVEMQQAIKEAVRSKIDKARETAKVSCDCIMGVKATM